MKNDYKIFYNEGMMPNQMEGTTPDGKHFYFRARGGWVALYIADTADECYDCVEVGENKTMVWGKEITEAGWWRPDEFEKIFWDAVKEIQTK